MRSSLWVWFTFCPQHELSPSVREPDDLNTVELIA